MGLKIIKVILMQRYKTRQIQVGSVKIGGDAPISVQSMTFSKTRDVAGTLEQINRLYFAGCDIVRCAVFNKEDIEGLREIKKSSPLPIVADIHFNHLYALAVSEFVDKIQAICSVCGQPATRSQRLINGEPAKYNDPIIQVGAVESYEARCRKCHVVYRDDK